METLPSPVDSPADFLPTNITVTKTATHKAKTATPSPRGEINPFANATVRRIDIEGTPTKNNSGTFMSLVPISVTSD